MVAVLKPSQKHMFRIRPLTGTGVRGREEGRYGSGTLHREGRHGLESLLAREELEGAGVPGRDGSREQTPEAEFLDATVF